MSGLGFRSIVFVGAHDEAALAAALASDADAVVGDLEDATPAGRKDEGRAVLARAFAGVRDGGPARLVRINAARSDDAEADLALAATLELDGLAVPQATADAVDAVAGTGLPVLAVVESARGLREAYDLASRDHVRAVQLGAKDLALDLGLEQRPDALELLHVRSRLVVDGVAAGLDGVFDRVLFGVPEEELEADARFARSLGFTGKSTTAPSDAAVINRVFSRRD